MDGGSRGEILRGGFPRVLGGDSGGPTVPYHFERGGGRSGESLYLSGGRRRGRAGRVGKGGATPRRIFYADEGLVALTDLVWLQGVFDTPPGLFKRVGIQTNIGKAVGML